MREARKTQHGERPVCSLVPTPQLFTSALPRAQSREQPVIRYRSAFCPPDLSPSTAVQFVVVVAPAAELTERWIIPASLPPASPQAHFDYFLDSVNTQLGGQRIATVLLYLCAAGRSPAPLCFPAPLLHVTAV